MPSHNRRQMFADALASWLMRSNSLTTPTTNARDFRQFLSFIAVPQIELEHLAHVRPAQVAAWRDHLRAKGLMNASIRRKLTSVRSLFSYLKTYGYAGANPAHIDLVEARADLPNGSHDKKRIQ